MTDRKDTMSEQSNHALPAHIQMALDGWVAEYKELLAFRETAQGTIEELQRQVAEADAARKHAQAEGTKLVEKVRALEAQLKGETVQSVTDWANETFGQATIDRQILRAEMEFQELLHISQTNTEKIAEEAADVCICLYRVIGTLDPEAINKKMAKNRARKWQVDGQGCAQHVGE